MKKRLISFLLALTLCLGLCVPALAYDDKVYDKDTLISTFGVEYDNVVVKSGVTVTFKDRKPDPNAIFIYGSLTVEEGGSITGPGTLGFFQGSSFSGIDLYYKVRGHEVLITDSVVFETLMEYDPENRLIFWWNEATGHFALTGEGGEFDPLFDHYPIKDAVYAESADLNDEMGCNWGNCVIRSGVTVTLPREHRGVHGTLTLEPGARMVGGCLELFEGAAVSGLTLWYRVKGEILELPEDGLSRLLERWNEDRLSFNYDGDSDRYVFHADFDGDPFMAPPSPREDQGAQENLHSAQRLNRLGLFRGTNTEGDPVFELERLPKRTEAVVLLIRLLGKDGEASAWPAEYAYGDIDGWACSYISYAFAAGLTNGVGGGRFNSAEDTPEARATPATPQQFLTFVLRALGYEDESTGGTDFSWRSPETLGLELHLIRGDGDIAGFDRGVCAHVMDQAMLTPMKDGRPLWQKLTEEGVFTQPEFDAVYGRQGS
jgi:hypothetical protein